MTNSKKEELLLSSQWVTNINKIAERILMNSNIDITTDQILLLLKNHFSLVITACYLLEEKTNKLYLYSFTKKDLVKHLLFLLPKDPFSIKYDINDKRILITKAIRENKIIQSKSLADFFYPVVYPKLILEKVQKVLKTHLFIAVPIKLGRKTIGVYFVAAQQNKFTHMQLNMLQFYVNLAGIALANNRKYKELEEQYQMERETNSILAHELKTPIAIAANNTGLAADLLEIEKKCKEESAIVRRAYDAIMRLNRICNSVLALREVESQTISSIHELHLKDHLLPVIQNFQRLAEKRNLKFTYSFDIYPGKFYGGGVQFEQIVTILLDNALKYTEKGSIDLTIQSTDKMIHCVVSNTGYVIPKDKRKAIFDRFYRLRAENNRNLYHTSGLGLGLYVALKLTEHINGSIRIERVSKEKGNQFIVEVPLYTSMNKSRN